ncbi:MAG: erythromycin esterase family protein [Caulobacteraceae bacterium]|nr:erythromycin esterase family protein [Caulobacteraceae bacterium]
MFPDRTEAGRGLAVRLQAMGLQQPVIYALPRGGVPVAVEVARALRAPLDLILVRKIGAPGQPEVALAAVVDGEAAQTVVNEGVRAATGADEGFLTAGRDRELAEIKRRRALYLGDRPHVSPAGRTAIVVDDGLATGATAKAALQALRRLGAAKVVLAVPVAPVDTLEAMRAWADEVVCLETPTPFFGVGAFYDDFHQLSDTETVALLAQAWEAGGAAPLTPAAPQPPAPASASRAVALTASARLAAAAEPLPGIDDPAFAEAFDRYAGARVVLLGEASHGTGEFYRARAAITRRLIEHHGFNVVAVEADWPDAAAIDRHVRLRPHQAMASPPFSRFPTWMWRNTEVETFVRWMREHNAVRPPAGRAAFYGLDLYNMRASMAAVLDYLDRVDLRAAAEARERYACLTPWNAQPAAYGRAALSEGYAICEAPVVSILVGLARNAAQYAAHDGESFFDASQNARLVADAERYYRAMYYGAHESWNLRDRHMFDTLERILALRGPASKVVVWAHNSHIGDARFTEMGAERGELNIGQLCRERFGQDAALIGFGTHGGTVLAASNWDAPAEVMAVRPSMPDSFEALFHGVGHPRYLTDLRQGHNEALRADLRAPRLERYIGVVYRPGSERMSHYAHAALSDQYDGFVWFDRTRALTPLSAEVTPGEDETYPFGL